MDRIDFEEWALKSIDPTLRPKPLDRLRGASSKLSDGEVSEKTPLTGNSGVKVDPSQRVSYSGNGSTSAPTVADDALGSLFTGRARLSAFSARP